MKKGICSYWGYKDGSWKDKLDWIKETGFDHIIVSVNPKYRNENSTVKKFCKYSKQIGLEVFVAHASYSNKTLYKFWQKGLTGELIKRRLIKEVKICAKNGIGALVEHFYGEPSEIGLKRVKKVLKTCEKYKVYLCAENILCFPVFKYLMKNIKSPMLKFCYDSGHNAVFDKHKYLDLYGDRLYCLHLHNNDGKVDQHATKSHGSAVDWDYVTRMIAKQDIDHISLETSRADIPKSLGMTSKEYLKLCYKDLCDIEKMIKRHKKDLSK